MNRWKIYLMERSPPAALFIITAGISLAPMAIHKVFDPSMIILGTILGYLLLVQMRLGDEIKDLDKDRKIHPKRPLPRGLLSVSEVKRAMNGIILCLTAIGATFCYFEAPLAGLGLVISTVFAWLMYKEFFFGASLAREPMIYALTHQLIVFVVYGWVGAYYGAEFVQSVPFQSWLLGNFGASFVFEICRKLDPNAPPEAGTYLQHYGARLTVFFGLFFVGLTIVAAAYGHQLDWLLPVQTLMILSLGAFLLRPERFKQTEAMAVLFAFWILWLPTIQWGLQALGWLRGPSS